MLQKIIQEVAKTDKKILDAEIVKAERCFQMEIEPVDRNLLVVPKVLDTRETQTAASASLQQRVN